MHNKDVLIFSRIELTMYKQIPIGGKKIHRRTIYNMKEEMVNKKNNKHESKSLSI